MTNEESGVLVMFPRLRGTVIRQQHKLDAVFLLRVSQLWVEATEGLT
jgi:hypothetical protein